jgi:hypothetical protein
VILPSSGRRDSSRTFPALRAELVNTYSVEAEDEAALSEYLESRYCRRRVLARHLDSYLEATSCIATDSILCDQCQGPLELQEVNRTSEHETVENGGNTSGSRRIEDGAEAI